MLRFHRGAPGIELATAEGEAGRARRIWRDAEGGAGRARGIWRDAEGGWARPGSSATRTAAGAASRRPCERRAARRSTGARVRGCTRGAPRTTGGTARPRAGARGTRGRRNQRAARPTRDTRRRRERDTRRSHRPMASPGARQLDVHDDERAVGPPGAESGMNLEAQRRRRREPHGAPEALERDDGAGVCAQERIVLDVRDAERLERLARGLADDRPRVAIEGIGARVARGARPREGLEEGAARRAGDERAARARHQRREAQLGRDGRAGGVEGRGVEREPDVQAPRAQRGGERLERRAHV